jgi:ribosomal-protein-alanine N-acetyltransferase
MFADLLASGTLLIPKLGKTLQYRAMREEDLPEVADLEQQLFRSPWSLELFREDLGQEYACSLVVRDGDTLAAYIVVFLVLDEMHIANVAVAREYQRSGIGYALLKLMLSMARDLGFCLAHLEVRRSNQNAIDLYEKLGFERAGLRKNYYENEHEDAILMSTLIQVNPVLAPR